MKKRIICSSCAAAASMLAVFCLSAYAVDAPEEETIPCTTTVATTTSCSTIETSRITTHTSISTTGNTTVITTIPETTVETDITTVVLDDPEPIAKSERYEEMVVEVEVIETEPPVIEEPAPVEEYVVYKPSSCYIHRNSCYWNKGDAYRIENTEGIEARRCSKCNPDMEIVNEYIEPEPEYIESTYCDAIDREYLAQIVAHEAGSDWIGAYSKACVVAVVMNRVNSSEFPNTIYGVLTQPYQFSGFWFGYSPSQSCYDAVDYYFEHQNEFGNILYFYGDGYQNYFY